MNALLEDIGEIDDLAIRAVSEAVGKTGQQRAMAAALMRHAGNALAKLSDHEDAQATHSRLARRHAIRMTAMPGRRR